MATIFGSNDTDVFYLEPDNLQTVSFILVNPYSSKTYYIEDEYNVAGSYDGLGGHDAMVGSEYGDYISIVNAQGIQHFWNIEQIVVTDGADIVNLAHATITYGDVIISGGPNDDILWGNVGNDTISGSFGNDILDGGPGNDRLFGGDDNDQMFGGAGNDILRGQNGDDILYGGTDLGLRTFDKSFTDNITFPTLQEGVNIVNLVPPGSAALGINSDNLTVDFGATATLTFREGFAGYKNTLGIYAIGEDGTIENASVLWGNVKTAGLNIEHQIDLPVGEDGGRFGFFIIADGATVNANYANLDMTGNDHINFIYNYGLAGERAAKITDNGNNVSIIYDDGVTIKVLSGYHYHTTDRAETPDINWDGKTHALSGMLDQSNQDILRIGFEDLPNLGDADYEDVLFDLDINRVHVDASERGNDILVGGAGNDILYGEAGDDILDIGEGFDQAYGGSGSDTILFSFFDTLVDKIYGFETGVGGDILNISNILQGYDPLTDALSDFVKLVNNGNGDTEIQINQDGDPGGVFTTIALFDGGLTQTMAELISTGNIVGDHPIIIPPI
ncbi:MAG: DUF4114 domain-containing protein [Alphaproteobacteria bacterium]|nr:DUF4114 domain-containing protein [Alphaproteobacteria bacterium]